MLENYAKAEQDLQTAMKLDSTYAPGWLQLGLIYRKGNQTDKAIQALNQSLKLDSTFAEAWFEAGALCMDQGKVNEACFRFQKSANLGFDPAKKAITRFCNE
jgi:tetratricopeptide (TPR) repeat protein